jgi:hypothetical protein
MRGTSVRGAAVAAAFAAAAWGVSPAQAQSVHLKGGAGAQPAFADAGSALTAAGGLAGLGAGDVVVRLTAAGTPAADCVNPGSGEHRPPGRNPAEVTVTGAAAIPQGAVRNGNVPFAVTTSAPVTPVPGAPDCPNPGWVENVTGVAFTAATLTVEQPAGVGVLTVACAFAPATSDGPVPAGGVACAG